MHYEDLFPPTDFAPVLTPYQLSSWVLNLHNVARCIADLHQAKYEIQKLSIGVYNNY